MYKTENTAEYRLIWVTPILKHQLFFNYVESSTEFRIYQYLLNPSLKNGFGKFLKSVHIDYSPFYSFTPKLRKLFQEFDFHIHFVQLLLFEEKMALRLFIKEIESFYFRFIGENYWIKEEKYIKGMEKEFNLILWIKEQLYRRKVKVKIESKYGKRLEEALKGQLILGAESWIEWVASTSTEETCDIVLTDQIFLLESE
ncbi:hypothetical protein [Carnobacterium maltaromaticum]|uniref:hypothetical protein n=1 Tax=Carnobacterium maltaromaticum TaxID=2751 RepID=UPI00295F277F|nr:hypothetical protein [Carnobacterium maltaromaticum]